MALGFRSGPYTSSFTCSLSDGTAVAFLTIVENPCPRIVVVVDWSYSGVLDLWRRGALLYRWQMRARENKREREIGSRGVDDGDKIDM